MTSVEHRVIPVSEGRVASLVWRGDDLVDHIGCRVWSADGDEIRLTGAWTDGLFNSAVASPSGRYVALLALYGTKGVLLRDGEFLRDISRSPYHADAYEYPAAFAQLADGREVLAHCPESYDRIEIEDADSGEQLTRRGGDSLDFFHSRLAVSADGRLLLSAGWFWHPRGDVRIFNIDDALADPAHLDGRGLVSGWPWAAEVVAAAFLLDDSAVIEGDPMEPRMDEGEEEPGVLDKGELGRWSLSEHRWVSRVRVGAIVGTMLGHRAHVLGLYDHPKLVDVSSGQVLERWSDIRTGRQTSSITFGYPGDAEPVPPIAMDPRHSRLAVAQQDAIHVLQMHGDG